MNVAAAQWHDEAGRHGKGWHARCLVEQGLIVGKMFRKRVRVCLYLLHRTSAPGSTHVAELSTCQAAHRYMLVLHRFAALKMMKVLS
jgi:hypothetical protein